MCKWGFISFTYSGNSCICFDNYLKLKYIYTVLVKVVLETVITLFSTQGLSHTHVLHN
jgi:hypothetical protein